MPHSREFVWSGCAVAILGTVAAHAGTNPPGIVPLQAFNRQASTFAHGVSRDGSVVVGRGEAQVMNNGITRAHTWTSSTGVNLGILGTHETGSSVAYGTNADGSVIVGSSTNGPSTPYGGFYWTSSGGMQSMGTFAPVGAGEVAPKFVSADGGIVAGYGNISSSSSRIFRWTPSNGYQDLGTPHGVAELAFVNGMSADGTVLTGSSVNGRERVFRWTATSGYQDLPLLAGANSDFSRGISANGMSIVGAEITTAGKARAFSWSESTGKQLLPTPVGAESWAEAVSADGSIIAGGYLIPGVGRRLALWMPGQGLVDLANLLGPPGVAFNGWSNMNISGISDDGSVIVGSGYYEDFGYVTGYHGFMITIPAPGTVGVMLACSVLATRRRR